MITPLASAGTTPASVTAAASSDSVRKPWATGPPKGLSARARATSTWIHWWSPVTSAKPSMRSWPTVTGAEAPKSWPTKSPSVAVL